MLTRTLSATQQVMRLRHLWPQLDVKLVRGVLIARGTVRPSSLNREYVVRLEYPHSASPRVYVESPKLMRRASEPHVPIPHTYDSEVKGAERPCVFRPGTDWHPTMRLGDTLMPWLMSWLVDYELWHSLGEWLGGGIHHGKPQTAHSADRHTSKTTSNPQ